jgi:formylmethanofuran dehydrogenase subunit C
MTLTLQLTGRTSIPLEVEGILPESLVGKSLAEIESLPIYHGKERVALAEFFRVSGDSGDESLTWEGELEGVHWIGAGMTRGMLRVCGSAGRHVGSRMRGGTIRVDGNVSDWLGGEMLGGEIDVAGNAGHMVGSAYRGSARGMTGGTLLVRGSAGNEIGHAMRRGLIAVAGDAGDLIGFGMLAGSILAFGRTGIRHGAGMRRGTIGLFGPEPSPLLPSFRCGWRGRLEILRLMDRTLQRRAFATPMPLADTVVDLHHGDLLEGGRGELLIRSA